MLDTSRPYDRGRRRAQVNLQSLNAAELIVLEKKAISSKNILTKSSNTWVFSLFALWTTWMLIGTCFYKFYTKYTWSKAFFMNVNVGWGLNWVLDDSFRIEYFLKQGGMQSFSLIHTVIGFIFILYFCIYIAMQLIVKKNKWLESAHQSKPITCFALLYQKYLPISVQEFDFSIWKFIIFFNIWIVVGVLWYSGTHRWNVVESIDYVFSTATGAGYKTIEDSSDDFEYAMVALYCVVACPLMTVSIGLIASTFFDPPHDGLIDRMFADICQEELDFMVDFGLIDTDGQMSQEEFIILMAVRINRASPELVHRIYERFQELDRKQTGKIDMNDLLDSKYKSKRHLFGVNKYNQIIVESSGSDSASNKNVTTVHDTPFFSTSAHAQIGITIPIDSSDILETITEDSTSPNAPDHMHAILEPSHISSKSLEKVDEMVQSTPVTMGTEIEKPLIPTEHSFNSDDVIEDSLIPIESLDDKDDVIEESLVSIEVLDDKDDIIEESLVSIDSPDVPSVEELFVETKMSSTDDVDHDADKINNVNVNNLHNNSLELDDLIDDDQNIDNTENIDDNEKHCGNDDVISSDTTSSCHLEDGDHDTNCNSLHEESESESEELVASEEALEEKEEAESEEEKDEEDTNKILLMKRTSQEGNFSNANSKIRTGLTIDTNLDTILGNTENMDTHSSAKDVSCSDSSVSSTTSNSPKRRDFSAFPSVASHLKPPRRRSSIKKNVFSIMETMQTEYIVHGNHVDNLFSPRKASSALHSSRKSSGYSSSSSPSSPTRWGISRRRSSRRNQGTDLGDPPNTPQRGVGGNHRRRGSQGSMDSSSKASVFSFGSLISNRSGSSNNTPTQSMKQTHPQQKLTLRKSKSMELPTRVVVTPIKVVSSPPGSNAKHIMNENMQRRRASLEASTRNLQLTKYYGSEPTLFQKRHKPPLRRRSLGGTEPEARGHDLAHLPVIQSSDSLRKEKTMIQLTEMNNKFKRRKSLYVPPPPPPSISQQPPAVVSLRQLFRQVSSFDDSVSSIVDTSVGGEQSSVEENLQANQTIVTVFGMKITNMNTQTYSSLLYMLKLPLLRIFSLWLLWIFMGGVFFTLYQQDNTSFACGLYMSVSVGIGMFWMNGSTCNMDTNPGTKVFSICSMLIGSIALGVLRAFVAHTMAESTSLWYMDVNQNKSNSTLWSRVSDIGRACKDHTLGCVRLEPKMKVHCTLAVLVVFGLIFSCARFDFSFLEGLFFSLSALTCGGFIPVPDGQDDWEYAMIALFITVGVPVTAVSLSLVTNSIVQLGSGFAAKSEFDHVMSILVTEKEIAMLSALDLEIGHVLDKREFTVLILLRVGAMTPAFVTVIVDWYRGISDHTEDKDEFQAEELVEFSSSESSDSDSDSDSDCGSNSDSNNDSDKGEHRNQRKQYVFKEKGRATLSFSEMMSFSQVEADKNTLRDRANNCLSSMVVE